MNLLSGITSAPKQFTRLLVYGGGRAEFSLEYNEGQRGWFFSISYGEDFALEGQRLTGSPNILRQYRNLIPFGLMVVTRGEGEPLRLEDFADDITKLYLLDPDDVQEIEQTFYAR